jgi:hypothetical protein
LVGANWRAATLHPAGMPIQNAFVGSSSAACGTSAGTKYWFGSVAEAERSSRPGGSITIARHSAHLAMLLMGIGFLVRDMVPRGV